jgi:hypothetical protein
MTLLTMHRLRFSERPVLRPTSEQQPYAARSDAENDEGPDTIPTRPGRITDSTTTAWVPMELLPWIRSTNADQVGIWSSYSRDTVTGYKAAVWSVELELGQELVFGLGPDWLWEQEVAGCGGSSRLSNRFCTS